MTITGLDVLLKLLKVVVFLFDVITFPIYKLLQQPWKERTKQNHGKVFSNLTVFGVMWNRVLQDINQNIESNTI